MFLSVATEKIPSDTIGNQSLDRLKVAQYLNNYATPGPLNLNYTYKIISIVTSNCLGPVDHNQVDFTSWHYHSPVNMFCLKMWNLPDDGH